MTLRMSKAASGDAAPSWQRHGPNQHCTAANSANGGCLIHFSKDHEVTSSCTAVARPGPFVKLRLRHLSPTCPGSRAPTARCYRHHLPCPESTDRRPFRTRPLKPVPTLARNGRLLTTREPPLIMCSANHRQPGTDGRSQRPHDKAPSARHSQKSRCPSLLHARPANTPHDLDPNPIGFHLPDTTFHCCLASSANSQYKQAAGSKSAHLQMISFTGWR
jgi:hypothetical protein